MTEPQPQLLNLPSTQAFPLMDAIDRMVAAGIDPAGVALPVMPGADPRDQPNATIFGLPVLWVDSHSPVYVLIGLK